MLPPFSRPFLRAVLLTALLLVPSSLHAHNVLRRSEPARGSRLTATPTRIVLWFTERPQLAFTRVHLFGPSGEITLGSPTAETDNGVSASISTPLPAGSYHIEWRTASADGHVVSGTVAFDVAGTGATPVTSAIQSPARADSSVPPPPAVPAGAASATARWIEFVALLCVIGAFGFRHMLLPPLALRGVTTADAADRARRLGVSAVGLYLIAAIVRAYEEAAALQDDGVTSADFSAMFTQSTWGGGWLAGVLGALLVAIGWRLARRNRFGTPVALFGALGMVFSPGLTGHAIASDHAALAIAFDALHVGAAGVWLGGLFHVVFAGIPATKRLSDGERPLAVAALVNSFHPIALVAAPLVVLAGVGSSWLRLLSWDALWASDYGHMLLRKLFFVAIVAIVGALNWLRIRSRIAESGVPGVRRARVFAAAELLFAAIVLGFTALLVTTAPPIPGVLP
jgi:copper transport protein